MSALGDKVSDSEFGTGESPTAKRNVEAGQKIPSVAGQSTDTGGVSGCSALCARRIRYRLLQLLAVVEVVILLVSVVQEVVGSEGLAGGFLHEVISFVARAVAVDVLGQPVVDGVEVTRPNE